MEQIISETTKKVSEQLAKDGGVFSEEYVHDMIKSTINLIKS